MCDQKVKYADRPINKKGRDFSRPGYSCRIKLSEFKANGPRQPCLPLVKCPEFLRLELKRTCHVQSVKGPGSQPCRVAPGQLRAKLEGLFRQSDPGPNPILKVFLELSVDFPRFVARQELLKDLPFDGVRPFCAMKRRKPRASMGGHEAVCLRRVGVLQVQ